MIDFGHHNSSLAMKPSPFHCPTMGVESLKAELVEPTIQAMHRQETAAYKCSDYLYQHEHEPSQQRSTSVYNDEPSLVYDSSMQQGHQQQQQQHIHCGGNNSVIDERCREKMCEWCFQMIDFCQMNRQTVSIAMSILDRYVATVPGRRDALGDHKSFQLAVMGALYTSIKIHEPESLPPSLLACLSWGTLTEKDIADTEIKILMALDWHVSPPTAISFCHLFMGLLPQDALRRSDVERILKLARFQTELAVMEYDLVTVNASTIAFAAIQNGLKGLRRRTLPSPQVIADFLQHIADLASIDVMEAEYIGQVLMSGLRKSYSGPCGDGSGGGATAVMGRGGGGGSSNNVSLFDAEQDNLMMMDATKHSASPSSAFQAYAHDSHSPCAVATRPPSAVVGGVVHYSLI